MAPAIEVTPCRCCRELVELVGEISVDYDLAGVVCAPCSYNLRGGHAWLKVAGLPRCIPAEDYNWHR